MNDWNSLDFFILLIFAANTILGIVRGATKEIISTMCLSIALIFTIKFTVPLAHFLNKSPIIHDVLDSSMVQNFMYVIGAGPLTKSSLHQIAYAISLLICFVGSYSVCEAMLNFSGFLEVFSFPYATLNRKLGGTLGFARGYIFNLVLISILALHLLENSDVVSNNIIKTSFFAKLLGPASIRLDSLISGQQPERYREILQEKPAYQIEDLYKHIKNVPDQVPPQNPPAQQ
jgi:uncharacterized membrane protein required for colicin V production